MNDFTISICGSKIFFEIIKEIKLFSKFQIKYFENELSYINEGIDKNHLIVFFIKPSKKSNIGTFPSIIVSNSDHSEDVSSIKLQEKIKIPFSIKTFEKKVISLIAKNEFRKNSLINLNGYIIDKNERKIKKGNLELKLSEKEINFLILFTLSKEPINRSLVLKNVWKYSEETETHTVETHIHRLRKKILEKFNDKDFIKNNNKGYFI